ncbi:sigma-E factor negative regulatory protein [Thiosocius teredinicola]|uniref:sigma-E factor negative regulatory protein n=1 Tax=Thiosocius teredinicola TaxID=1973002 RepID=UPI000991291D
MNEKQSELVSALLDGELSVESQQRTVSAMLADGSEDLERFGRYRLIGDVMRGESAVAATEISARVRAALQDEPVVLAPPASKPNWLRPVAGLAVAASVATAAVLIAPQMISQTEPAIGGAQVAAGTTQPTLAPTLVASTPQQAALPVAAVDVNRDGATRWEALDEQLEDRLNRLVIEHQEYGGRTGINGPVPHIGLAGYEAR